MFTGFGLYFIYSAFLIESDGVHTNYLLKLRYFAERLLIFHWPLPVRNFIDKKFEMFKKKKCLLKKNIDPLDADLLCNDS